MAVLKTKNDLGLFEDPYHGASEERSRQVQLCPDHRAAARKAAAASAVLLKNEGILPLQPGKIAFIGPYARHQDLRSAWSFSARAEDCVSLEEGAKASPELAGWQLRFASGCTMLDNHTRLAIGGYESSSFEEENQALLRLKGAVDGVGVFKFVNFQAVYKHGEHIPHPVMGGKGKAGIGRPLPAVEEKQGTGDGAEGNDGKI